MKRKRPSLFDLDKHLANEIAPHLGKLESLRKRYWLSMSVGLLMLVLLSGLVWLVDSPKSIFQLFEVIAGCSFALGAWLSASSIKEYKKYFKQEVMTHIAQRFFPDLRYQSDNFVSQEHYETARLYRTSLDTYEGNDYFSGKLGQVDFQFSELLCQYTSGSGKSRKTVTAFRGFFFVGDFHREFYFRTQITPDTAESFFGFAGRGLQRLAEGKRLVDLEDPEFEKKFKVTSDDQVEARYLITPVFMQKMVDFHNRLNRPLSVCFANGKLFMGIETNRDFFEPRLWGSVFSRRDLCEFIDTLTLLLEIAELFLHHPKIQKNTPTMPHRERHGFVTPPPIPTWYRKTTK